MSSQLPALVEFDGIAEKDDKHLSVTRTHQNERQRMERRHVVRHSQAAAHTEPCGHSTCNDAYDELIGGVVSAPIHLFVFTCG